MHVCIYACMHIYIFTYMRRMGGAGDLRAVINGDHCLIHAVRLIAIVVLHGSSVPCHVMCLSLMTDCMAHCGGSEAGSWCESKWNGVYQLVCMIIVTDKSLHFDH